MPTQPVSSLYLIAVHHRSRCLRVMAMGLIFQVILVRSLRLYIRELALLGAAWVLLSYLANCSFVFLVVAVWAALQLWCWLQAARRVEHIAGHRAGAEGYAGMVCENTVEAMEALALEDNGPSGPVENLHYIEVDVHETSDGELVVFHDAGLLRAFPNTGPNIAAFQKLQLEGHERDTALVKDLTTAQLRSLHLAGRPGLHAPTLACFLAAFRAAGCRRPVVIEVKQIATDKGRQRLLDLILQHKTYADQLQQQYPEFKHPHLEFLAVISFPHFFTASFGEFGSAQWRQWGQQFTNNGIPMRCCFLEQLSYCHGLKPDKKVLKIGWRFQH